jgi:hypothetical protein
MGSANSCEIYFSASVWRPGMAQATFMAAIHHLVQFGCLTIMAVHGNPGGFGRSLQGVVGICKDGSEYMCLLVVCLGIPL